MIVPDTNLLLYACGNLATNALIAAHALDAGARVCTTDRDFARFPSVVAVNPLT